MAGVLKTASSFNDMSFLEEIDCNFPDRIFDLCSEKETMGAVMGRDVLGMGMFDGIRASGRVSCNMRILSFCLASVDVLWITTTLSFGC